MTSLRPNVSSPAGLWLVEDGSCLRTQRRTWKNRIVARQIGLAVQSQRGCMQLASVRGETGAVTWSCGRVERTSCE